MKDERLEELSDKVRMGQPIGFTEVMEVIRYQEQLRKEKKSKQSWFAKIVEKIKLWLSY